MVIHSTTALLLALVVQTQQVHRQCSAFKLFIYPQVVLRPRPKTKCHAHAASDTASNPYPSCSVRLPPSICLTDHRH
ncbi:hypothetical protein BD779DRAFT_1554865 [Infundibulicybe gibba]|nr:hypothetical protein BD779DRAFT_1554865 [Infundibulicybe gibba]